MYVIASSIYTDPLNGANVIMFVPIMLSVSKGEKCFANARRNQINTIYILEMNTTAVRE